MWNVHYRVMENMNRTNNHAEAAHRRLQCELMIDHPTLWKFIDGLKSVQKGRDVFYESLVGGHAPPRKLRKYREADERIRRIVGNF
jgi:hypothetical protein